ncbi:MAG: hypothetical protein ABIE84_06240, partial [bacterium]
GIIICIFFLALPVCGETADQAIYTDEYGLAFSPQYPPYVGQEVTLRIKTLRAAQKVTLNSDRDQRIETEFHDGYWWGHFRIPEDYQIGSHYFTVWIRYPVHAEVPTDYANVLKRFGLRPPPKASWSESKVWYQLTAMPSAESLPAYVPLPDYLTAEAEVIHSLPVTGEEVTISKPASLETGPLKITGSQTISFKTRSLTGSKEGYAAGTAQTREETLRINVAGKAADTDIEASIYRTSATGITQIGERDEEISILLKRGSFEAYLGDFTADFTGTEFTRLDRVLSGGWVKGEGDRWGFKALYSSPKGEEKFARFYGDNTQGPYQLDNAPVVIDSERVNVDGVLQQRGDDYSIDYQSGTISFLKRVVDLKSVVTVIYDYRQTLYNHATYGLRATYMPAGNLKVAATFLDDSDSLSDAAAIRQNATGEVTNPQKHYVIGSDINYSSQNLTLAGEGAFSYHDLDILTDGSTKETGKAGQIKFNTKLGQVGLQGHLKRVGLKFKPIAEADPKQDVWEYGAGLSYRPGSLFGAQGNYEYQKYLQGGTYYENLFKTAKAQLVPAGLPSLSYNFTEVDESNDPVTGSQIRRIITKNAAETIYQLGFVSTSLKGSTEKWLRRSPSEETTNYQRLNIGLATIGLDQATLSTNVELENRQEQDGAEPFRRTYNLNLSLTPVKHYFIAGSFNIVDDSSA